MMDGSPVFTWITVAQDATDFTIKHQDIGSEFYVFRTVALKDDKNVGALVGIIELDNRVYELYRGDFMLPRSEMGRPIAEYS